MKGLFWDAPTIDFEVRKSRNPETMPLMGATVYMSQVLKAVLKYGTFDRLFVMRSRPDSRGDIQESALFTAQASRIRLVSDLQFDELRQCDRLAFFTPMPHFSTTAKMRRLAGCPAALTAAVNSVDFPDYGPPAMMMLAGLHDHDAVICPSEAGRIAMARWLSFLSEQLESVGLPASPPEFQLRVIPIGVDTSEFQARPRGALRSELELREGATLLYFGRFSAASKADLLPLILAFRKASTSHPHANLVLAGDDTQYRMADALRSFAATFAPGVSIRVVPNPDADRKKDLYATADVFVSPTDSIQETFGIGVIEAMAAGLPAVVSDWNGYRELVVNNETGFRIRTTLPEYEYPFDELGGGHVMFPSLLAATTSVDVADLAVALTRLISDGDLRRSMGEAAQRKARSTFDWSVVIGRYEELWEELAASARRQWQIRGGPPHNRRLFSYREIFSHYSTDALHGQRRIRRSEDLVKWGDLERWLCESTDSVPWFRRDVFEAILDLLPSSHYKTLSHLLDELGPHTEFERMMQTAHLCRLIKYGVVQSEPVGAPVAGHIRKDEIADQVLPATD